MDWLIYHLVGDMLTHYWYGVQMKIFGYVRNKKQKGIVVSVALRAHDILDTNVILHLDGEDIAMVASTNRSSKVWTIHALAFEWPQCNYHHVVQGIIYKHVMKIFKMLHPHILDGAIV
jgi:hypothetical protein